MGITIKKIASELKLAVSTVSKALAGSHEISPETRQRVVEYARSVDYIPNAYASSLRKRTTGNIGVVLPEVADSFFSDAINGIESVARQKGYHVIIYLTHDDQQKEQAILNDFRSGRVDGVLMSVSLGDGSHTHIEEMAAQKPLVFFDRAWQDVTAARVLTDDVESGYNATHHLLEKGCRRIGFLSVHKNLNIIQQRLQGYKNALADHGRPVRDEDIIDCTHPDTNYDTLKTLLTNPNPPDGLVCSVESLTLLAYRVCHALNLAIPNAVRVVGFSNLGIAALLNPPLTTITQPAFAMGQAAATLLFNALERRTKADVPELKILPSVLHERASTQ
ncbi:LacI family DNA-binding transcriptional regulator [Chryseolinea lacunae]|uniref:LacI family DNA-binding transcriptional regulator n=1 Tax=Chryseolinea lacunae TaxID=2801331 RepID=A0ABS1KK16_9BACT|nr:LacI family DNA-binding transcriptional regulator [Chryseolinea lacunae]MBL0739684.1 LacI family DNA-binding transcriptional regulator [Chryseolinea lacunae]